LNFTGVFFSITEIIGTIAFAVSGALLAIERRLDLFGVLFLSVITALGGGVIRDLIIGSIPPWAFTNPEYLALALFSGLATFVAVYIFRARFSVLKERLSQINNYFDALGLAAFSMVGAEVSLASFPGNWVLCLFLGMTTGIGGGILRDIMSREVPYVFKKHIYGVASLAGCGLYWVIWTLTRRNTLAALLGMAVVITIRVLATHFHWNLPRILLSESKE